MDVHCSSHNYMWPTQHIQTKKYSSWKYMYTKSRQIKCKLVTQYLKPAFSWLAIAISKKPVVNEGLTLNTPGCQLPKTIIVNVIYRANVFGVWCQNRLLLQRISRKGVLLVPIHFLHLLHLQDARNATKLGSGPGETGTMGNHGTWPPTSLHCHEVPPASKTQIHQSDWKLNPRPEATPTNQNISVCLIMCQV